MALHDVIKSILGWCLNNVLPLGVNLYLSVYDVWGRSGKKKRSIEWDADSFPALLFFFWYKSLVKTLSITASGTIDMFGEINIWSFDQIVSICVRTGLVVSWSSAMLASPHHSLLVWFLIRRERESRQSFTTSERSELTMSDFECSFLWCMWINEKKTKTFSM